MSRGGAAGEGAASERKPAQELSIKEIKDKNEVRPAAADASMWLLFAVLLLSCAAAFLLLLMC